MNQLTNNKPFDLKDEEITKKLNIKTTIMGLSPETWVWGAMTASAYSLTGIIVSFILQFAGETFSAPALSSWGAWLSGWSLVALIPFFILNIQLLKKINRRFGENTAFLVLAQHNPISVLINKKVGAKNYTFDPMPNNNYKRII